MNDLSNVLFDTKMVWNNSRPVCITRNLPVVEGVYNRELKEWMIIRMSYSRSLTILTTGQRGDKLGLLRMFSYLRNLRK